MAEDKDSKTEEPTDKRLGKARGEGDVPVSQEIKSVAMLFGGLVVVGTMAGMILSNMAVILGRIFERLHMITFDQDENRIRVLMMEELSDIGWTLLLPMGVLVILALVGTVGQNGFLYTPKKLQPKLSNINPINGVKRMFGLQAIVEFLKGLAKMVVVGAVVAFIVIPQFNDPSIIMDQSIETTLQQIQELIVLVLVVVVLVLGAIAYFDLIYQKFQHKKKLKMTKQEVKDEHKESEGDPKVKGRIRALRQERHRQRMMAAVPEATVVVTNPTHYAVALTYNMDDMAAPKCVAKGVDYIARRIRQIAEGHDVPIVEDPPLARALHASVEVDQEIPEEHYKAVAEVIGYVMRLRGEMAS